MFESGCLPDAFGNTYELSPASTFARSRISIARGESGTRCTTPAFMRSAGMVHVFVNGAQVLKNGEHTGAKPGQVVRGPGGKGWK